MRSEDVSVGLVEGECRVVRKQMFDLCKEAFHFTTSALGTILCSPFES
jgi:hypothetical protein